MKFSLVILALYLLPAFGVAATIWVPDDYSTIQGAIDAAANGDEVIVRPDFVNGGPYFENIDFSGKAITVKSEQGPSATTIDGQGSDAVTLASGEGLDSIIEGFSIKNSDDGVYCGNASATIRDNLISYNYRGVRCGYSTVIVGNDILYNGSDGINCSAYDGTIDSNTIDGNQGDGIRIQSAGLATVSNNIISRNDNGIYCNGSDAIVDNNLITLNNTGAGILSISCDPIITNNTIMDNHGISYSAGGIDCSGGSPSIISNIISFNVAGERGGGIRCEGNSAPLIINNIISGNVAKYGGGIYLGLTTATVVNNTICNNTAYDYGGGIRLYESNSVVINTIIWDNDAANGDSIYRTASTVSVSYSDVEGGWSGQGNIDVDPLFVDPVNDDYHLSEISPCLDKGDNDAQQLPLVDNEGDNRIINGDGDETSVVDMGADELRPWIYVPGDFPTIQSAIDAAENGDDVLVGPGVYVENLDFVGKTISVRSEKGSEATVVDGGQVGSVVTFQGGEGADSIIEGFTITNGQGGGFWPTYEGGGITCHSSSSPTIRYNIVEGNTALASGYDGNGGGIACSESSPIIISNIIRDNSGGVDGGGLYFGDSSAVVLNNAIVSNTADHGAGLYCWQSTLRIENDVFFGNSAYADGGAICSHDATPVILNSILWNNSATRGDEVYAGPANYPSVVSISYSVVKGGLSGTFTESTSTLNWDTSTMIDADPLFVDPVNNDFHIPIDSPCFSAGYNLAPNLPDEDFEGDPRLTGYKVDIGVDEFHTHLYTVGDVVPGDVVEVKVTGFPWFPATLAMSSEILNIPLNTAHGTLYLKLPALWQGSIGSVPSNGVLVLPVTVPTNWSSGEEYYLQALVGPWGGLWTQLTNYETLVAE